VETLCLVLPKLIAQERAAGSVQAWQLPPAGGARGGVYRCIEPVVCSEGLDDLQGLHTIPRDPAAAGEG
jgi:hypothetical protein